MPIRQRHHTIHRSRGFTLIEVILAVVVLASGLTIILGLQSSIVSQTIRDRNREYALLAGRQILAQLEAEQVGMEARDETKPLAAMLSEFKGTEKDDFSPEEQSRLKEFFAHMVTTGIKVPGIDIDVLTKISLTISWSSAPIDSVEIIYFVPAKPEL